MPLTQERQVLGRNATAIILDGEATPVCIHCDADGTGFRIDGVLDDLFDGVGHPVDYLLGILGEALRDANVPLQRRSDL